MLDLLLNFVAELGPVGWMAMVAAGLTILYVAFVPTGESPSWGDNMRRRG